LSVTHYNNELGEVVEYDVYEMSDPPMFGWNEATESSASGPGSRKFPKDSSTLQDAAFFHIMAHITGQSDRMFVEFLREVLTKFWKSRGSGSGFWIPGCRIWILDLDRICLGGDLHSQYALVMLNNAA